MSAAINFARKFNLIKEQWTPKVIAEMNDYQFKLVKIQGEFVWHSHADTDETFIVIDGELRIDLRDGAVTLAAGKWRWCRAASNTGPMPSAKPASC